MAPRKTTTKTTTTAAKTAKQTATTEKIATGKLSKDVQKAVTEPVTKPAAKKAATTKKSTSTASKENTTNKVPVIKKAPKKAAAATKKAPTKAAAEKTAAAKKRKAEETQDEDQEDEDDDEDEDQEDEEPQVKAKPATTEKATTAKKRKAEEDVEHEEPKANSSKRRKGDDESISKTETAPRPHTAAAKKPKIVKPRAVINHSPTQRLDIYVSGEGSQGELGLGAGKGSVNALKPRLNPNLSAADVGVVQLAAGGMHCAALTHDNKILTWGVNDEGALGRDTQWDGGLVDVDDNKSDDSSNDVELNPREATPTAVEFTNLPEGTIFTQVTVGDSTTFALTDEGQVYGWGTFRVSSTSPHQSHHN
jgi:regulator of chromosome condensation